MDLHEFELRTKSYSWLNTRFDLWRDDETIFSMVKKSDKWQLTHSLQETSVEDLWWFTRQTYTQHKQKIIDDHQNTSIWSNSLAVYIERLEYEFKVIDTMWYNTYFLIVQDYIERAKRNTIVVGPGRWSCAGSLLSYVMWITDLDPLAYDLIFERFLNPGRISMPDIDTDFEDTQRDKVIEYIRDKYGKENVAHIGTYMTMAAKAAFKDVARVYGINFEQSNKLSALITEKTIQKSIKENKDLQAVMQQDQRVKNVLDIATTMEGTIRQTWVHACGMIIAPEPTTTYTVIQYPPQWGKKDSRDESRIVSQYDGRIIEHIGLLKMDLLWLRNLSIIKNTVKILKARAEKQNTQLDPLFKEFLQTMLFHPPLDDMYTYQTIFHTGNTSWVFQFESDGMRTWLKKLRPTRFDDLIAMVSLYRPWPMDYIPHYIDRKYEIEEVRYMEAELFNQLSKTYDEETAKQEQQKLIEDLWPFMGITYGIPVYQEQLMRLVQAMAWFSMAEADKLRKWVGKKIKKVIEKIKGEFIEKSWTYKWYKPETAQWVYEKMIEPAADYSFNKSHAACYAYISYQTAWLKAHYPLAFHAALLRSVEEDTDKLAKFVDEITMQWIEIRIPHIQSSYIHVAAFDGYIELWLVSIKWLGYEIAKTIEEERNAWWLFVDLPDFLKRCSTVINKKSLEALVKAWTLDIFADRASLQNSIKRMLDWMKWLEKQQAMWWWLFAMGDVPGADLRLDTATPYTHMQILAQEFSMFKCLISSHPFDGMFTYLKDKYTLISMMKDVEWFGDFNVCGMIKSINRGMRGWFFLVVEDVSGDMEFFLNEKLDLKIFDIINISWYKGRRFPSTSCIQVFSYDTLRAKIEQSWKFKPEDTVAKVRKERFESTQKTKQEHLPSKDKIETSQKEASNILNEPTPWYNTTWWPITDDKQAEKRDKDIPFHIDMPDDIHTLTRITNLIKQYPWDITIHLGSIKRSVSEECIKKIKKLL